MENQNKLFDTLLKFLTKNKDILGWVMTGLVTAASLAVAVELYLRYGASLSLAIAIWTSLMLSMLVDSKKAIASITVSIVATAVILLANGKGSAALLFLSFSIAGAYGWTMVYRRTLKSSEAANIAKGEYRGSFDVLESSALIVVILRRDSASKAYLWEFANLTALMAFGLKSYFPGAPDTKMQAEMPYQYRDAWNKILSSVGNNTEAILQDVTGDEPYMVRAEHVTAKGYRSTGKSLAPGGFLITGVRVDRASKEVSVDISGSVLREAGLPWRLVRTLAVRADGYVSWSSNSEDLDKLFLDSVSLQHAADGFYSAVWKPAKSSLPMTAIKLETTSEAVKVTGLFSSRPVDGGAPALAVFVYERLHA